MSVLAPLKLQNIGSPHVESLLSYVIRLAHVHSVSPTQMLEFIESRIDGGGPRGGHRLEATPSTFVAYSNTTSRLVSQLEGLTGVSDLSLGTYLALRPVLTTRCSDVVVPRRRWCPECYWSSDPVAVEPLHWLSPYIKRCHVHMTPFVESCVHCGLEQSHVRALDKRRHCSACGKGLVRGSVAPVVEMTAWDAWSEASVLELLEYCSTPDRAPLHPQPMAEFTDTVRMFGRRHYLHLGYLHQIVYRRKPGQKGALGSFFSLAALQSCSPLSMMLNPRAAGSPIVTLDDPGIRPPERNFARNARAAPRLEQLIQDHLGQPPEATLPTLTSLVTTAGASNPCSQRPSVLALTRVYGAARRRRQLEAKILATRRALQVALGLVRGAAEKHIPTQRILVRTVMEKAKVAKHVANAAISSVVHEEMRSTTVVSLIPSKSQRVALMRQEERSNEGDVGGIDGDLHCVANALLFVASELHSSSTDGSESDASRMRQCAQTIWRCQLEVLDFLRVYGEFVARNPHADGLLALNDVVGRISGQQRSTAAGSQLGGA